MQLEEEATHGGEALGLLEKESPGEGCQLALAPLGKAVQPSGQPVEAVLKCLNLFPSRDAKPGDGATDALLQALLEREPLSRQTLGNLRGLAPHLVLAPAGRSLKALHQLGSLLLDGRDGDEGLRPHPLDNVAKWPLFLCFTTHSSSHF